MATLIHEEKRITAGDLKITSAYDLKLIHLATGDYKVVIFMKLQFFFKNDSGHIWSKAEKSQFMKNWETAVKNVWGGRTLKTLSKGKKVTLNFEFKIQEAGWMYDHWEITVVKIKSGSFKTSYVTPSTNKVRLDSEDLNPVNKGASSTQRGAVHEFGHMLGLDDEYNKKKHIADKGSVMHSAEAIRPRHNSQLSLWLQHILAANKIK